MQYSDKQFDIKELKKIQKILKNYMKEIDIKDYEIVTPLGCG